MGFRFRKRLRIFPGLWLNLSKKGGSLSVGGRGATVNGSPKGHQETWGCTGFRPELQKTRRRKFGKPAAPATAPHGAVTVVHGVSWSCRDTQECLLKENYPLSQAPENAIIRRLSLRPLRTIL